MSRPDFLAAKKRAQRMLENELPGHLRYHTPAHTLKEVLPAVERIAEMENITREDLLLLRTAALYHDLGFIEQSDDHEIISARMAEEILPQYGYSPEQVEVIQAIIFATRSSIDPKKHVEEILVDADFDILGRENYLPRIEDLRLERESQGIRYTDEEWLNNQIDFLNAHRYWTASAQALREEGKRKNTHQLKIMLKNQRLE